MKVVAMLTRILCVIFGLSIATVAQRNRIDLSNNEYTGVLVAIHESIPEDPYIIQRIKEIFTSASGHLYTATEQRAYFKSVDILIPRTWSDNLADDDATTESFCAANVIVDQPNPVFGDNPYVKNSRPCGEPGEYVHLTEKWLTDVAFSEYNWGDSGKLIVHEWGHLRWGLFDEYAIDADEHFYFDQTGRVEPTRCSQAITGQSVDIVSQVSCNKDPNSGVLPGPHCRFFPDPTDVNGIASYMFASFQDSVVHFCHSDPLKDPNALHNRLARNKQNKLCGLRSAWDVMLITNDFFAGANAARLVSDTTPLFRVVKETDRRIVLVLDVSGSMSGTRFNLMVQACTKYLRYTIPDNTYVGIVKFESDATTLSNLVFIDGTNKRDQLISALPTGAGGSTCIGCGLNKGVEVLEAGPGLTAEGGIIFLLTDGVENTSPLINDVKATMISKKVIINTLAFSEYADNKLTELSQDTNGLAFYYSESNVTTGLHDAFAATVASESCSSVVAPVQLISYKTTVSAYDLHIGSIHIDSTIGLDTTFFIFFEISEVDVILTSPSGQTIIKGSTGYTVDLTTNAVVIFIAGLAETGTWQYEIINPYASDQSIEFSVESKSSDGRAAPIRLTSTLSSNLINESPPMAVIYADLNKGYAPVTKATVLAIVDRPDPSLNPPVEIQLFDSGVGADVAKDDGIYSAYFIDFVEAACATSCRYSVKVTANDENGNTVISTAGQVGALPKDYSVIPELGDPIPVGDFNRIASGGVIQIADGVEYAAPGTDPFPPAAIGDLEVSATSYDDLTVKLQWTATGDDLDQGTAHHYDLRFSLSFSDIADEFENSTSVVNVTEEVVVRGSLDSALPSGSVETVTIRMHTKGEGLTFYFAIRAIDDFGNKGETSNIAQSTLVPQPKSGLEVWHLALIAVGCLLVVAVVITGLVCVCKPSKAKNKVSSVREP